ncbi:uncharacterized protein LOC120841137 [Ixodes scapularis]|uniref:uncharacterized protein LOC120841137 n=1 Tax=Ixodes scapularis TaxID=6945 RepID=UPI001A9D645E|nr:uncharacterized protein LOC120841137 [Ixodes scapularis]
MGISMKNRFQNIFVSLLLILALVAIEQVFAGSCIISQHKFNKDTISVNTVCKVSCYGIIFYAGSTSMCILKHKGIGYVFTILTGVCDNGECRKTNESEIYKRELEYPLYDTYNPQDKVPWPFECQFINVQDKQDNVFLSTACSVTCKDDVVKMRRDGTPCILSTIETEEYYANITVGKCQNGRCVSDGRDYGIQVEKELVKSRYEETYEDYRKKQNSN